MSDVIQGAIAQSSLLKHLSQTQQDALAACAEERCFENGEVIIAEGSPATHLYLIARGVVRVSTTSTQREIELKKLGPGAYFGEVSLLSGKEATATVSPLDGPATLIALSKESVAALVQADEKVRRILEGVTLARAKDTISKVLK